MVFKTATVVMILLALGCSLIGPDDPPPEEEPLFAPGEYGGEPLPGTEHLFNVRPSPDGNRIAFVRERTPDEPADPKNQLWIVDRDGSNPQLIGVNIGTADWSPDGKRLAVTVAIGINVYIYTIDLETMETMQWTGKEDHFISKPTASNPVWFKDGRRLLVGVMAKAYQQPFERGIYAINTETGNVEGPFVEVMQSAFLGGGDRYATGKKYTYEDNPLSGNFAKYTFSTGEWKWITDLPKDSLDFIEAPAPDPTGDLLTQSRTAGNADQLFLMNSDGENARQVTRLGGDNPRWSYSGEYVVFRRDVHRGPGARYIPFRLDLATLEAAPLFATQPDSLPQFPPLETQALNLRK